MLAWDTWRTTRLNGGVKTKTFPIPDASPRFTPSQIDQRWPINWSRGAHAPTLLLLSRGTPNRICWMWIAVQIHHTYIFFKHLIGQALYYRCPGAILCRNAFQPFNNRNPEPPGAFWQWISTTREEMEVKCKGSLLLQLRWLHKAAQM
jgi:hypothetical protein